MRGNDDAKQIARCAVLACLLEATARKPGNVHPQASFRDLTYADFVRSAHLIGPSFEHAGEWSVGRIVRDAVERTRREVSTNTNLGILLLLAPLASVPPGVTIADGIGGVLAGLTREDARLVYEAIRLANPGGLGQVENEDVAAEPSVTLLEAMQLAADRDRIAQQFANNFATVLAGADRLAQGVRLSARWEEAVIELHLWLMAQFPDTLIARKCGDELARESALARGPSLMPVGRTGRWPPTGWPSWMTGYVPTEIAAIRERRRTWSRRVCSSHFARAGSKLRKSWSGKCRRLNGGFRVALAACPKVSSRVGRRSNTGGRSASATIVLEFRRRGSAVFADIRNLAQCVTQQLSRCEPIRRAFGTRPRRSRISKRRGQEIDARFSTVHEPISFARRIKPPPAGRRAIPCRSSAGPFRRCRIATRASSIDNSSDPKAEES